MVIGLRLQLTQANASEMELKAEYGNWLWKTMAKTYPFEQKSGNGLCR